MTDQEQQIGHFYRVPCLRIDRLVRSYWICEEWLPVLGRKHEDGEFLDFPTMHYHIDWRFVSARTYEQASRNMFAKVICADGRGGDRMAPGIFGEPELRRKQLKRLMPEFPAVGAGARYENSSARKWQALERAQAVRCNKLIDGHICPHRGIDLTPFVRADGTVICPGHGLQWNMKTGELMPRHAL